MFGDNIVLILIFLSAGLAAYFVQVAITGATRGRARTASRFGALGGDPTREELDLLRKRASGLAGWGPVASFWALVLQSGLRVTVLRLGLVFLCLALVVTVGLPRPSGLVGRLLLGLLISGTGMILFLRIKRARRSARFAEQLPEVIDVIVRSLRAGHPMPTSLALVAREMQEPAGPEFSIVVDEVNYGRSLTEALQNMDARVGYSEMRYMVAAIAIATQTGGNLGEILARLATMLRMRFRLRRRVRALSAEGRFSGIALSALPVLLFGLINLVSPSYYAEFWSSPSASTVMGISLAMLAVGNLVIYRMVNFRV